MKVELWSLETPFFGCIVGRPTGVIWTQQTGGTKCHHPELEGLFVPLPLEWLPNADPLYDQWWHRSELDWQEAISKFIASMPEEAHRFFEPRECKEFGEAWVPVRIREVWEANHDVLLNPFAGESGVLVYVNSD